MWYLEIAEDDTEYRNFTEFERRMQSVFSIPSKAGKTERVLERWVNASTPASLARIPDHMLATAQTAMTAGEISALVSSDPGGYSVHTVPDHPSVYCAEVESDTYRAIITDGDSIISVANSPWNLALADRVYSQVGSLLGNKTVDAVINVGVGGRTLTQLDAEFDTKVGDINVPAQCDLYYVIMAGTNDINAGASAATTFSRLRSLLDKAVSAFPDATILVVTPIARLNSTKTATLDAYRTLIIDNALDYEVVDAGRIQEFRTDEDGRYSNTTYYQADAEHPTAAGAKLIAAEIVKSIEPPTYKTITRTLTPEDYSAVGNGVAIDTTPLQNLFAAVCPGDSVYLAPGKTYLIDDTIQRDCLYNVRIYGGGKLKKDASFGQYGELFLSNDSAKVTVDGILVEQYTPPTNSPDDIDWSGNWGDDGIVFQSSDEITIKDCTWSGTKDAAWRVTSKPEAGAAPSRNFIAIGNTYNDITQTSFTQDGVDDAPGCTNWSLIDETYIDCRSSAALKNRTNLLNYGFMSNFTMTGGYRMGMEFGSMLYVDIESSSVTGMPWPIQISTNPATTITDDWNHGFLNFQNVTAQGTENAVRFSNVAYNNTANREIQNVVFDGCTLTTTGANKYVMTDGGLGTLSGTQVKNSTLTAATAGYFKNLTKDTGLVYSNNTEVVSS